MLILGQQRLDLNEIRTVPISSSLGNLSRMDCFLLWKEVSRVIIRAMSRSEFRQPGSSSNKLRNRLLSRREFLDSSARNAAGVAALGVGVSGLPAAAESGRPELIRLGVIGLRNRGSELAQTFAALPGTEISAICDVDRRLFQPLTQALTSLGSREPLPVRDYRELIEHPEVDAVVVATPDHQHFPMAVQVLQAKKPLYLEVPVTHTSAEAEQLLGLQSASGVLVQTGLTHRSGAHFLSAIQYLRSGQLGHVHLAKAWATHRRQSIGRRSETSPPEEVDYAAWLGPARELHFRPNRFHYHWRWHWDLGAGELGNWGVHLLDLASWGLDVKHPTRVISTGGKFAFDDDQQTPDTQQVCYDFGHCAIQWEHRQWSPHANEGRSSGVAFYGEQGTLILDRGGWKVYGMKNGDSRSGADATPAHCRNFLDAIRGTSILAADLSTGLVASSLCHAGNTAYRSLDA